MALILDIQAAMYHSVGVPKSCRFMCSAYFDPTDYDCIHKTCFRGFFPRCQIMWDGRTIWLHGRLFPSPPHSSFEPLPWGQITQYSRTTGSHGYPHTSHPRHNKVTRLMSLLPGTVVNCYARKLGALDLILVGECSKFSSQFITLFPQTCILLCSFLSEILVTYFLGDPSLLQTFAFVAFAASKTTATNGKPTTAHNSFTKLALPLINTLCVVNTCPGNFVATTVSVTLNATVWTRLRCREDK